MNVKQNFLYATLKEINGLDTDIDKALTMAEEMPREEVQEVVKKFNNEVAEFNEGKLYDKIEILRWTGDDLINTISIKI